MPLDVCTSLWLVPLPGGLALCVVLGPPPLRSLCLSLRVWVPLKFMSVPSSSGFPFMTKGKSGTPFSRECSFCCKFPEGEGCPGQAADHSMVLPTKCLGECYDGVRYGVWEHRECATSPGVWGVAGKASWRRLHLSGIFKHEQTGGRQTRGLEGQARRQEGFWAGMTCAL